MLVELGFGVGGGINLATLEPKIRNFRACRDKIVSVKSGKGFASGDEGLWV